MAGNSFNNNAVCCFCGNDVSLDVAIVLNIQSKLDSEEIQQFFCHKEHLLEHLHKSVKTYLHPDIFDNDDFN